MKKTLLLLVALITATIAFAQTEIDGIYYYLNNSTQTAEVTYQYYWDVNNYSGITTITIPEKVTYNSTEYSVTSIGDYAFAYCSSLTSISIPNGVTSIGYGAFFYCDNLTSITIPNSVTSIGDDAFSDCSSLTSIEVDANNPNYASIEGVLYNKDITTLICCPGGKTSITIPNSVTSIGERAFENCSSLTSITIPNSVTSIGIYAFRNCSSLTSITIGNSVTSIGNEAFSACSSLTSITIPNSVTSIGEEAFFDCDALTSITIPNSVTYIGNYTFYSCDALTSISIPNSVTSIGNLAFFGCSSLTSITIPNSVTSIGNSAFYSCSSLTSISIEATTPPTLGISVFENTNLAAIYIPDNTLSAYKEAWGTDYIFVNSENTLTIHVETPGTLADKIFDAGQHPAFITTLTVTGTLNDDDFTCMRETMTSLVDVDLSGITNTTGVNFNSKSNLLKILLPENLTSIGNSAFSSCDALTSITIGNSVTSIEYDAFYRCSSLTSITIPNSVTSIGSSAFYRCSSLTSITIPNSVTSIGGYAFYWCESLTSITIPNSVTSIGGDAFSACSSLTSIEVDANNPNYASIEGVLYNKDVTTLICCPGGKTSITIPNGVTSIGDFAFRSCSSLTSITIPNSVTSIGKHAFSYCSSLTSISIPNSVTSIGDYAFFGCSSLTSITIPNSVTSIGNEAFSACSSLTSIEVDANSPNYASIEGILYNKDVTTLICCPGGKTSITIPNSVTSIGDYAFSGCSSLTSITCLGSTPPSANNLRAQYETCILFVPKGSLNDYQNHAEWGKFLNIQELKGEKYAITTAVNDESMGSVTGEGEYEKDSEITLTATANSGYRFVQWSAGNTDNPRTIIVTQDSTFTAIFELEEYALYATSASPELGYVKHTIEAIAIEGFEFDGWSDGNTDNPRTIVLTEDTKLYAYFRIAQGGNPVDLETSKISSANIYTTNGTLHIEGATENYHILDAAGRLIYSGNASTLTLPRGIYLITMGGEVEKIVL